MKIFLFLCLLFAYAQAQTTEKTDTIVPRDSLYEWAPVGTKWYYGCPIDTNQATWTANPVENGLTVITCVKDTIVENLECKLLEIEAPLGKAFCDYRQGKWLQILEVGQKGQQIIYIDSFRKVYVYSVKNGFQLLYDFDMSISRNYQYYSCSDGGDGQLIEYDNFLKKDTILNSRKLKQNYVNLFRGYPSAGVKSESIELIGNAFFFFPSFMSGLITSAGFFYSPNPLILYKEPNWFYKPEGIYYGFNSTTFTIYCKMLSTFTDKLPNNKSTKLKIGYSYENRSLFLNSNDLEYKEYYITMLDLYGHSVLNKKINILFETISLENLPNGIYFIHSQLNTGSNIQKILIY